MPLKAYSLCGYSGIKIIATNFLQQENKSKDHQWNLNIKNLFQALVMGWLF